MSRSRAGPHPQRGGKPKHRFGVLDDSFLSCQLCDKVQLPKTQTNQLTLHPNRIALTSCQLSRIQEINQQVKSLTQRLKADEKDVDANLKTIDQEIAQLRTQLQQVRQQTKAKKAEFNNHWESGAEPFEDITHIRSEIHEMERRKADVHARLEEIKGQKAGVANKIEESRKRFGIRSINEGESRIEQIDDQIQRETLTNAQLKRLLSEQDRLRSGIRFLGSIPASIGDQRAIMNEERDLQEELHELSGGLHELRQERKMLQVECNEISARTGMLRDQKKELKMHETELASLLDHKNEQRESLRAGFGISRRMTEMIHHEIESLEDEKMRIYIEAEAVTLKATNEHRRQKAAIALIEYLSQCEIDTGRREQSKDTDAMNLIAILRQGSKKGRKSTKTEEMVPTGALVHDLNKLKLFEFVQIIPPKSIHEIPETTVMLQQKLREWTSSEEQSEMVMEITEMPPAAVLASR
jgi:hypothetical protein